MQLTEVQPNMNRQIFTRRMRTITAFVIPCDGLSVKWLKQYLGGGFKGTDTKGRQWIVSLIYPSGVLSLIDGHNERTKFKQWKQALANRGQWRR